MDSPDDQHDLEQDVVEPAILTNSGKKATGRPKTPVWEYFEDLGRDVRSHRHVAKCKYCDAEWPSARVAQLKTHVLSGCKKIDPLQRSIFLEQENALAALEGNEAQVDGSKDTAVTPKAQKRKLESSSVTVMEDVHTMLLRWLITAGLPLETIESHHLGRALRMLNSSYICPTAGMLAGPLLSREHRLLRGHLTQVILQESFVSLGVDSWAERGGCVVAVHLLLRDKRAVFWKAAHLQHPHPLGPQDPQQLIADKLSALIEELGTERVAALVCTPEVVRAAQAVSGQPACEGLAVLPCFLHAFGSLMMRCLAHPYALQCLCSAQALALYLSDHQQQLSVTLTDSEDICSAFLCLRSVHALEKVLKETTTELLPRDMAEVVADNAFWTALGSLTALFEGMYLSLRYLQSAGSTPSGAVGMYVHMAQHLESITNSMPEAFRSSAHLLMNRLTADLSSHPLCKLSLFMDPALHGTVTAQEDLQMMKTALSVLKARGAGEQDCRAAAGQWMAFRETGTPEGEQLAALGDLLAELPLQIAPVKQTYALRGGIAGDMLRLRGQDEDLQTAATVLGIRSHLINLGDPSTSTSTSSGVEEVLPRQQQRITPEGVRALLRGKEVLVEGTKKSKLDRIPGIAYDHQAFAQLAAGIAQAEAADSDGHPLRRAAGRREDFSVDHLIMEFV